MLDSINRARCAEFSRALREDESWVDSIFRRHNLRTDNGVPVEKAKKAMVAEIVAELEKRVPAREA